MAYVNRRNTATQKPAATNARNFRTFLLMQQFAAEEIGARIAQARNERGLTQDELSDLAAGFSKRSLQDYEAGKTIPYKHLRELSQLLKKPTEWFLYGDVEAKQESEARLIDEQRLREIVREEIDAALARPHTNAA
jgi:transcriptional regulator with XRE-family HTH domain